MYRSKTYRGETNHRWLLIVRRSVFLHIASQKTFFIGLTFHAAGKWHRVDVFKCVLLRDNGEKVNMYSDSKCCQTPAHLVGGGVMGCSR